MKIMGAEGSNLVNRFRQNFVMQKASNLKRAPS